MRPNLEVADIFRRHGEAWRQTQHGHLSLGQIKVMSAIERCRSAELGGHVLHCRACGHDGIAYNSCRNRHCPKCQGSAAKRWLKARQNDLLPVEYYHAVFTLPAPISAIGYYNKSVVYRLLFEVAAETLRTLAADPKYLGAQIGATLVLHTWGSAMTHHPHVHGIVPGGGLSLDGNRWVACKPGFSSRSGCCLGCSGGGSWMNLVKPITPANSSSLVNTARLAIPKHLPTGWHPFGNVNGWPMQSARLLGLRLSWPTCHAIPTG